MSRNVGLAMRLAACRTGLLLVAALCATPGYAESLDELYQLAKQEKTLVMWAAGPSAGYERAARAFEQRFPGITVSLKGGFSNVLNTQIEHQVNADKIETDLVVLQTIQNLVGWNTRGLLLHFKPDEFDRVRVTMRDRDGAWIALNTNPVFYAYNTDSVRMEDVPTSAIDFLKVYFKGKLISAYPADDDATLYAFHTIVEKYGRRAHGSAKAQMPDRWLAFATFTVRQSSATGRHGSTELNPTFGAPVPHHRRALRISP